MRTLFCREMAKMLPEEMKKKIKRVLVGRERNDTAGDERVGGHCWVWRRVLVIEPENERGAVGVCEAWGCGVAPERCKRRVHPWPNKKSPNKCVGFGAQLGSEPAIRYDRAPNSNKLSTNLVSYQRRRAGLRSHAPSMERPQINQPASYNALPSISRVICLRARTLRCWAVAVLGFAGVGQRS